MNERLDFYVEPIEMPFDSSCSIGNFVGIVHLLFSANRILKQVFFRFIYAVKHQYINN